MPPVKTTKPGDASPAATEENAVSIDLDVLRTRLGLPDDATEEQINEALAKPTPPAPAPAAPAPAPTQLKELPPTEPYRVSIAGAIYQKHREGLNADGEETILVTRELAMFRQEIELTEREARRLLALGAVRPKDDPLGYDEMDENQLKAETNKRGIEVRSTGADPDQPLRIDYVNALLIYDQGQGKAT